MKKIYTLLMVMLVATYVVAQTQVYKGTQVKMTATPKTGYHFCQWNDGNLNATRTVTVNSNVNYVATFASNSSQHTITTAVNNANFGTVLGGGSYDYNSTISLISRAMKGYHFVKWQDGDKNATRSIKVLRDAKYTATFAPDTFKVVANVNDAKMGSTRVVGSKAYKETTKLYVDTVVGYSFFQWNDGNKTNPRSVVVMQDTTLMALLQPTKYAITAVPNNAAYGDVTGGGQHAYNNVITLTATPKYGYEFERWSDGNTTNPRTIVVSDNNNYSAIFKAKQYNITATSAFSAQGSVSGSGMYDYNTYANVLATAKSGAHFVKWSDGNTENPRVITVLDNVNLVAEFDYNDYTLTTQVDYADRGTVTYGESIKYTFTKELTATPKYGYVFKNWTVSGAGSSLSSTTSNPATFTMGTENATVTANFDYDKFDITAIAEQPQMGTVSGSGSYNYLSEQYVTATPLDARYRFVSWSDGNTENPRVITVLDNVNLVAEFDYDDNPSGVSENAHTVLVYGLDMHVIVQGAATQTISVYNVAGQLLETRVAVSDKEVFDVYPEGVYIVNVGESTYKVVVR